jgi:hypothetical protein
MRKEVTGGKRPAVEYCTFREAQALLGEKRRGSIEGLLRNGSLRFFPLSPHHGKVRLIYRRDVTALMRKRAE